MLKESRRFIEIASVVFKYRLFNLKNDINSARNLRLAFEELGPIFIKLGQLLSTRHDLLPVEYIKELSKLQDQVKPFDNEIAHKIIKQELHKEYNQIFSDFSQNPIASASIAQVYTASLNGKEVIVKLLRPNLSKIINRDICLLKSLIKLILKFNKNIKRFKPDELIIELERVLVDEQDLLREAANASQLRRNFKNNKILYIPNVYWQYCTKNILVLERISGVSINNIEELDKNNTDLQLLAKRGVEIFFTQVFEHCLFHGDLHPGNIFIDITNPRDPKYNLIDFGIMGSLGPDEQYYLAANLWAFINKDYRKIAELHIESGWVDPNTRVDLFEAAIRTVSEPILEKPVSEISFGELLVKLFDTAREFNMQLQPQLLVFKKSLINVEGIAHKLDPNLNLWEESRPYIEKWMQDQVGVKSLYKKIKNNLPVLNKMVLESPQLIFNLLKKLNKQTIVNFSNSKETDIINLKKSVFDKIFTGKVSSILFIVISLFSIVSLNYNTLLFIYYKYSYAINNAAAIVLLFIGLNNFYKFRLSK